MQENSARLRKPKTSFPNLIMTPTHVSFTPSPDGAPKTPGFPKETPKTFMDSLPKIHFEKKTPISFSKDLGNSPNNHKDLVKVDSAQKAESVFFGKINLRDVKIEIEADSMEVVKVVKNKESSSGK